MRPVSGWIDGIAGPFHKDDGANLPAPRYPPWSVRELKPRARPLQKCFGNEEPKTHPLISRPLAASVFKFAVSDKGIADPADKRGWIAGSIVRNPKPDRIGIPVNLDLDGAFGKVDSILDQIA